MSMEYGGDLWQLSHCIFQPDSKPHFSALKEILVLSVCFVIWVRNPADNKQGSSTSAGGQNTTDTNV